MYILFSIQCKFRIGNLVNLSDLTTSYTTLNLRQIGSVGHFTINEPKKIISVKAVFYTSLQTCSVEVIVRVLLRCFQYLLLIEGV